jgi:alpha,alpha-trehalose phosphorylase
MQVATQGKPSELADFNGSSVDPWQLVRRGTNPADFAQEESLFALANGALGVRGGIEEYPSASQGSFLAAVWERSPIDYHERFTGYARTTDTRVPVADATGIRLQLGNAPVRLGEGEWLGFERALDLRSGCYRRELSWRSPTGATLEITAQRIVALDEPGLLAMRYQVRSVDYTGPISLESTINTAHGAARQGDDPRIGAQLHGGLQTIDAQAGDTHSWVRQQTANSRIRLACGQQHRLTDDGLRFQHASSAADGVSQTFTGMLLPGQSVTLEKYVAYAWSLPDDDKPNTDLTGEVERTLSTSVAQGYVALLARQTRTLEQFWRDADLAVSDAEIEQALRFNLFHLYQSSGRDGHSSTAAKGLTGEGYEGHYFWDAEAFMLPALVSTAPQLARSMLTYRYETLDRARLHARELDHPRGALYAWRTISGDECSSYFPGGSAQYHINADIAWAIRLYLDASGDEAFLLTQGAEMLFETARIWLDIGHFNARHDGAFCIHEVTGPDEYSALVDNNYYTNRMAQRHLRDAAAVAAQLAASHPIEYAALAGRIELTGDEAALWQRAADAMYLPVDARLNIFPQDDGFLDKPRLPTAIADAPSDQPLLLRLHPMSIYRHQVCKQADTVLALMLAGDGIDTAAKRRNFDYYEGVTVHDSTLSASTFAVMASEVGHGEKAYQYFLDTLRVDLDDLHGNAAHGIHMAAMAGSWLALVWGFGGFRVRGGEPSLAPQLPQPWSSYRFGLRWRDAHLRVEVDRNGVHYSLTDGDSLTFLHNGVRQQLNAGRPLHLACADASATSYTFPRPLKAVIFDLDGVIADTAVVHHAAWKQLADEIGIGFDDSVGERLKGVDRLASLDIVLERATRQYSLDEKLELAARKNDYYREQVQHFGPENLLPGARTAIASVKKAGLKTALASASKNAPLLLERLGIADLFDYVVDANRIARSKPDPEIFLAAASALGVIPSECLGVEDAAAGIASIHAAGMAAVGIGRADALPEADVVLPDVAAFDIGRFAEI